MEKPHNLYIHIPFCTSKCNYCAFASSVCIAPDWDGFCAEICAEIDFWGAKMGRIEIPTVFFGGGTPSLMPPKIFEKIMMRIRENFDLSKNCEITIESNPGTLSSAKLFAFKNIGMNRLSIGIQSFDDKTLQFMGRRHSAADAMKLIESAMNLGIRTSGDFIYGLPGHDVWDIQNMCKKINEIGLMHASIYELSIEPGTPFYNMNLNMPGNDIMADMYLAIDDTLKLNRYEVSNYSAPQNECAHNQNIWDGEPYIGIGKYAAGRVLIGNTWYEQMGGGQLFFKIGAHDRIVEKIIMGMRTTRGIILTDEIGAAVDKNYFEKNSDMFSIHKNGRISASEKGILILDNLLINWIL